MNPSKSNIVGVNLPTEVWNALQNSIPFPKTHGPLQYLGIALTSPLLIWTWPIFYLITKIDGERKRLGKFSLSWMGRLAAYKMSILPRMIYFFRAAPICVLNSQFQCLLSEISLKRWILQGLTSMQELLEEGNRLPFSTLTRKYSIPIHDYLLYSYLAHIWSKTLFHTWSYQNLCGPS